MGTQKYFKHLVVASALISSAFMVGCSHTPEAKADRVVKKIDSRLNLNAQQETELTKLKDEALADYHGMKVEKEVLTDEVQKQLEAGKLDREALKKLSADQRNKRASVMDKWIDNVVTFHEGLDAKQKEKVLKDMKKLRAEMRD